MGIAIMLPAQTATQQRKQITNTEILLLVSFMCLLPNACRNRAATKDCPFQIGPTSPLRFTALFGHLCGTASMEQFAGFNRPNIVSTNGD